MKINMLTQCFSAMFYFFYSILKIKDFKIFEYSQRFKNTALHL